MLIKPRALGFMSHGATYCPVQSYFCFHLKLALWPQTFDRFNLIETSIRFLGKFHWLKLAWLWIYFIAWIISSHHCSPKIGWHWPLSRLSHFNASSRKYVTSLAFPVTPTNLTSHNRIKKKISGGQTLHIPPPPPTSPWDITDISV